ncbi:MAG: hypothetical protein LC772_09825 [Chloroflexi bacterium]|nr:hypothetical protein [Chloroflexota bacterium]
MEPLVIEGVYEDGKIELENPPTHLKRARVRVTFLSEEAPGKEPQDREAACQRAFARMEEGINFGGEKFNREEIYDERMRELEERQDRHR